MTIKGQFYPTPSEARALSQELIGLAAGAAEAAEEAA